MADLVLVRPVTLSPEEMLLNQVAQKRKPWADAITWFESVPSPQQEIELRKLAYICHQAHPRAEEIDSAITLSGLKPTHTPCVLVRNAPVPENTFHRLIALPEEERQKTFRLLLGLFCVADTRRRQTICSSGCSHEWHNLEKA